MNMRKLLFIALLLFYLLHNDLWLWVDHRLVLGLPVGLTYHIAYSLLAMVWMYLLVRFAWPAPPDDAGATAPQGEEGPR